MNNVTVLNLSKSFRGIGVRQVRIVCGLVMFSYLLSHYSNHALGNVSYATMNAALRFHLLWWRSLPVATVLYTAATVHLGLGLWALYQRRQFRYTAAEIVQLFLGLSIPLWLVVHFSGVRLSGTLFGREPIYSNLLLNYWTVRPYMEWVQFALLLVAWTHGCIGIYSGCG